MPGVGLVDDVVVVVTQTTAGRPSPAPAAYRHLCATGVRSHSLAAWSIRLPLTMIELVTTL